MTGCQHIGGVVCYELIEHARGKRVEVNAISNYIWCKLDESDRFPARLTFNSLIRLDNSLNTNTRYTRYNRAPFDLLDMGVNNPKKKN